MGLFRKSLHSAIQLMYWCIANLWVTPLEKIASRSGQGRQSRFKKKLCRSAAWLADAGRAIVMDLRLTVKLWSGESWSVVYIGEGISSDVIKHYMFPSTPLEEELSKVFLWQVPSLIRKFSREGNLVICEFTDIVHFVIKELGISFSTPPWVQQILEGIDRPIDEILMGMNQTMRRNIRRLETQGYTYEFSKQQDDFDLFYHQMFLPYIGSRFSELSADILDYDHMNIGFQHGGLILVKLNQSPICGMLCILENGLCEALDMGVLNGDLTLVKQGSNVALWWYMLDWARQNGAVRFDFGGSRPFMVDGVFNFKRQWGTRIFKNVRKHTLWSFYGQNLPELLHQHLTQIGLITIVDNKGYRIVLTDLPVGEENFTTLLKEAVSSGLAGLLLITQTGETQIIST